MDAASLLGKKAPRFTLRDQAGHEHDLEQYNGRWVALYFYSKDDTMDAIRQACDFRDKLEHFEANNMVVLGVSRDAVPTHTEFAQKYDLNFPILSDEKMEVMRAYGAWGKKNFEGREYDGVIPTTFLIDPEGIVRRVYTVIKPDTHVAQILAGFTHLTH